MANMNNIIFRILSSTILGLSRLGAIRLTGNPCLQRFPIRVFSMEVEMTQPIQDSITKKLTDRLKPSYLDITNESFMHNVPKGSETHFKVVVVSENFENTPLLERHRMVNEIVKEELQGPVHALSIQAKTPQQWERLGGQVSKSPPCLGGAGK